MAVGSVRRSGITTSHDRRRDQAGTALHPAVHDLLDSATGAVAVVVAPGGYGKTMHVRGWAQQCGRPMAWLDLDRGDDEPSALLDRLVDALSAISDPGLLDPDCSDGGPSGAVGLGRSLARSPRPFVLVLDDVQAVSSRAALDTIADVVGHVGAGSTVVLVGRAEPAVPLGRLRASGDVVDVSSSSLALTPSQTRSLLGSIGVHLDDTRLAQLVDVTEGWPLGLRLLGESIAASGSEADIDRLLDGRDRAVAHYVWQEWLSGIASEDIQFLMRVSGVATLSGDVCDHLLDRVDSGAVLERLHRDTSVLIPLDRRDESYRLHRLVRAVLLAQFERTERRQWVRIERQASEWFEERGDVDAAVHHALRIGDLPRLEGLVFRYGPRYSTDGRWPDVARWLDAFPRDRLTTNAALCLLAIFIALRKGDGDEVAMFLRFAERAVVEHRRAGHPSAVEHELAVVSSLMGRSSNADVRARAAAARDALAPGVWHALSCVANGALAFEAGDVETARELLEEGAIEARLVGAPTVESNGRAHLAMVLAARGNWGAAVSAARSARRLSLGEAIGPTPSLVLATACGALVAASESDPELARGEIARARQQLVGLGAIAGWANVQARVALAQSSLRLGDRVTARALIGEIEAQLRDQPDAVMPRRQLAELEEQLRRAQRDLPTGPAALTAAELRVLHYLPTNLTHHEIGQRLFVSRNTAKSHAASVYRKLGAASRAEAVEIARSAGLLADASTVGVGF